MRITFNVSGNPKGQPRARAFYKPGLGVRMYDAGTAEGWKGLIAVAAREHLPVKPLEGPLEVSIMFLFERPKSHYRTGKHADELRPDAPLWHTSKPDRDNLEKAVLDCLTTIGMWKDDCQVCAGQITKLWSTTGRMAISIATINQEVSK
jgi:Holliday junction resolvase RusA-like endonuclease